MSDYATIEIFALTACACATLILSWYYLAYFVKLKDNKRESEIGYLPPVSVVISARNESANLRVHLPLILEQDYPDFEVVVINDASWDDTEELLNDFCKSYSRLRVVTVREEQKRTAGKKMALTLGFKKASKDVFLLTDADCRPCSNTWIREMCAGFKDGIRLGYGGYETAAGLMNLMVRLDTWSEATQYLSAAEAGKAYMGVGRNMAYSRSHYHDSGGFKSHYHIMSGDDDLMVNHTASKNNCDIRVEPNSHTISIAANSWGNWWRQKRRHMSVSGAYSGRSKRYLGIYHSSQLIYYMSLALIIAQGGLWKEALILFSIKTTIQLLISIPHGRILKEMEMVVLLPVLEPIMLTLNLLIGIWSRLSRPKVWK